MIRVKILFAILVYLFISINAISKPLAAYRVDSVWYIIDEEGRGLFNPLKLNVVAGYSEGFYKIMAESEGYKFWAFMNDSGAIAVPLADDIRLFNEGMSMLIDVVDQETEMRLYGFIDKNGKMAVQKNYLDATDFSEGLAWVMNREERGYINKNGKFVIKWDTTGFGSVFSEGLAAISDTSDRFGFIDKTGKLVIDYQFDEVTRFIEGVARVNILSKWGFIDKSGKVVVDPKYDFSYDFVDGFCFVGIPDPETLNPLWGVINKGGGEVVDFQYSDVRNFSEGIGAVKFNEKWKYIDYFGNQVINKLFNNCDSFKDGLAWAESDEKIGFINPFGEFEVILPKEAELVIDLRINKKVK